MSIKKASPVTLKSAETKSFLKTCTHKHASQCILRKERLSLRSHFQSESYHLITTHRKLQSEWQGQ